MRATPARHRTAYTGRHRTRWHLPLIWPLAVILAMVAAAASIGVGRGGATASAAAARPTVLVAAGCTVPAGPYANFAAWQAALEAEVGCWTSATPPPAMPGPTPSPSPSPTPSASPSAGPIQPLGIPGTWTLKLDSEFARGGLSAPWAVGWFGTGLTGPVNSAETLRYDPANVTAASDGLHLTVTAHTGALVQTNPSDRGGYAYVGGVAEARICLPGSAGRLFNWPAFWTDGQSWPADGEDDVMEGLSGTAAYHFHSPAGGPGANMPGDWTGCHVYASRWVPGVSVTYYYDGRSVGSITSGVTSAPMYLILDYTSAGTPTPATAVVTDVRVWQ
jgi:hypothetical protein